MFGSLLCNNQKSDNRIIGTKATVGVRAASRVASDERIQRVGVLRPHLGRSSLPYSDIGLARSRVPFQVDSLALTRARAKLGTTDKREDSLLVFSDKVTESTGHDTLNNVCLEKQRKCCASHRVGVASEPRKIPDKDSSDVTTPQNRLILACI